TDDTEPPDDQRSQHEGLNEHCQLEHAKAGALPEELKTEQQHHDGYDRGRLAPPGEHKRHPDGDEQEDATEDDADRQPRLVWKIGDRLNAPQIRETARNAEEWKQLLCSVHACP